MDRKELKLRVYFAAGQVLEDIAKLLLRCGARLIWLGNKLADWAERR